MNIIDLIQDKHQKLSLNGKEIDFFLVAKFKNVNIQYGFCLEGWIVINQNNQYFIGWNQSNYISFLKLLELPFEDIKNEIIKNTEQYLDFKWLDFFPIGQITLFALESESDYWSLLCLDFILNAECLYDKITIIQEKIIHSKWASQRLKHMLIEYKKFAMK